MFLTLSVYLSFNLFFAKTGWILHKPHKGATYYVAGEVAKEGERDSVAEAFDVASAEVYRGEVENRFATSVHDGRAVADVAIHAVGRKNILHHGKSARARKRADNNQFGKL